MNDTLPGSSLAAVAVLEGCEGSAPTLEWPREDFPWAPPEGWETSFPTPFYRGLLWRCATADVGGMTWRNVSFGWEAHSNLSPPSGELSDVAYDELLWSMGVYADPPEFASILQSAVGVTASDGTVRASSQSREVNLATDAGAIDVALTDDPTREGPGPRRSWTYAILEDTAPAGWLVVREGEPMPGAVVSTWSARGDVALADWPTNHEAGTPTRAAYYVNTTLTLEALP